jgi:TolB-like protein
MAESETVKVARMAAPGISLPMARAANREGPPAQVPDQFCRAHLERVTSSATFGRAEQLRRLLGWLGERALAPGSRPPTEKEIGETILRRRDFDPQTDSLVRKEMSRLREKLVQYYAREGARDRVRICHRGGYMLAFAWAGPAEEATPGFDSPCVLVLPFRSEPDLAPKANRLAEELTVGLGQLGSATLVSPTTALSYAGRVGDVREFAAECGADYVVEGSLELCDTHLRATLWFVNGRSGRTERPARFNAPDADALARPAASWLNEQIARLRVN